jgi:sec-independent protein translocase protein TatA
VFTNGFGWPHLLIIAVLIIVLFGAKRLPDAARGLGKSMRIFRAETRGMHDDEAAANQHQQQPPQQLSAPFAPPQAYNQQPQQQYAPPQQPPVTDQTPTPAPQADQQR